MADLKAFAEQLVNLTVKVQKVNESNVEKATLGDLNILQSLKEDLEKEGK